MTSNTNPSGKVSASGSSLESQPFFAFSDAFDRWRYGITPSWLEYEFPTPRTVTKFRLECDWRDEYVIPKKFNFEAYNESTNTWEVLKAVELVEDAGEYEAAINNTTAYKRYRLHIFSWFPDYDCGIDAFKMYETVSVPSAPSLAAVPGNSTVSLAWDNEAGVTGYNVKRSETPGGPYITLASGVTSGVFYDNTAVSGKTYYYVVSAVNHIGESTNSNVIPLKYL